MAVLVHARLRYPTIEYGARRWIIALGIALAPLLETVDSSVVNVALPAIRGNLGASLDEATYLVTGYLTANAVRRCWASTTFCRSSYKSHWRSRRRSAASFSSSVESRSC